MKKRSLALLVAISMMAATISGCGGAAVSNAGENQETTVDASQSTDDGGSAESGADAQDGDVQMAGSDAKWDGTVEYQGLKIKVGMTVNDILSQGDYVIYTHELPEDKEDLEVIEKAVTDMVVNPILESAVGGDRIQNENLYIYKKDGDDLEMVVEGDVFYYNPNPYAIPLGECVLALTFDGDPVGYESFDSNKDGNVSVDEFAAAAGTELAELSHNSKGIAYDDFFVRLGVEDDMITYVSTSLYGLTSGYDKGFEELEKERYFGGYEVVYNTIDPSQCPFTFKTGFGTYSLDLSEFSSIDRISQTYIEESDFTPGIIVEGTLKSGVEVEYDISCGDEDYYLPIEKYHDRPEFGYLSAVEVGDDVYYRFDVMGFMKLFDGSINVRYDVSPVEDESFVEAQNAMKSIITEVE